MAALSWVKFLCVIPLVAGGGLVGTGYFLREKARAITENNQKEKVEKQTKTFEELKNMDQETFNKYLPKNKVFSEITGNCQYAEDKVLGTSEENQDVFVVLGCTNSLSKKNQTNNNIVEALYTIDSSSVQTTS
ncbi:hypothetical protein MSUIS_01920 [Mycoplasma suis KI3806]|uniref:Uncharacterized protein n=1 Tax=Mycoplasma suis (strain KI_3806) TaxID=708248 RepID=F0V363_MYCS3|nr:hypothetical protein [Mycoplasma suis]CBZ40285.1 hypothetical protein MSUIS_01920 [Mycoplasma suis KI3806]